MSKSNDPSLGGTGGGTGGDDSNKTLTIGSLSAGVEGLPTAEVLDLESIGTRKNPFGQGALLILIVLVIAGGALYAMRVTQSDMNAGPSKETLEKIDKALGRMSGDQKNDGPFDAKQITALLTSDSSTRQVPIEFVKKNPFELPVVKPVEAPRGSGPAQPGVDGATAAALRKAAQEVREMRLQTVMNGRVPMAVVNDKLVKVGDKIGSLTVRTITGRGVELEAVGKVFVLNMETQVDPKGLK